MRLCIVGDPYGVHDIGERKTVGQIAQGLKQKHDVLVLKPKDVLSPMKLKELRRFRPEIIHYWAGPRFQSFVILWAFKTISAASVSLNTAIRPQLSKLGLHLGRLFKPDLILAQSEFYLDQFRKFGFATRFLPNGVDTSKFLPVDGAKKQELRSRYSIPGDEYVISHVGHITPWRSLEVFNELARDRGTHVLIVGSTSLFEPHPEILAVLKQSGCDVRLEFFPNIAEVYQLSDCYVFPGGVAQPSALPLLIPERMKVPAIEIPLSVLEARACGLSVVTSRFGGLESLFASDEGVHFCNSTAEILETTEQIREEGSVPAPPAIVERYDWVNVLAELTTHYDTLSS